MLFVIARNSRNRPTLQHRLVTGTASVTMCGIEMFGWSRAFQTQPIDVVLCRKCAKA